MSSGERLGYLAFLRSASDLILSFRTLVRENYDRVLEINIRKDFFRYYINLTGHVCMFSPDVMLLNTIINT